MEELVSDIIKSPATFTTSKWIIERIPYIFENNFEAYIEWKEKLSQLIGVDSKAIVFTGSSCIGFSMNPYKNFKAFESNSDIDVAIVSSHHFDVAWHYLRNIGPKFHRLKPKEQTAITDHRERLIYHGTIATDKIVHIFPFGNEWVNAMNLMMDVDPTKNREINFRIYKDFEALKSYQIMGINKVREKLLKQ